MDLCQKGTLALDDTVEYIALVNYFFLGDEKNCDLLKNINVDSKKQFSMVNCSGFLIHLLSFLPVHPSAPQNHAIVQETKLKQYDQVEQFLTRKKPYQVHFSSHVSRVKQREEENRVYVSIPELFSNLPRNDDKPVQGSMAHYQYFSNHRFSKYISYGDFCRLEKSMSRIVANYLQDEKRSYIIVLDDIFLNPMGIWKYWDFPKNYLVFSKIHNSLVDFVIVERFENTNFI